MCLGRLPQLVGDEWRWGGSGGKGAWGFSLQRECKAQGCCPAN